MPTVAQPRVPTYLLPAPLAPCCPAANLCLAACCRLPLLVTLHLLRKEDRREEEDTLAWWHGHAGAMSDEGCGSSAGAAVGGKLVGGSRQVPQLDRCARCGACEPAFRCKGCRSAAFCSKDCQRAHWVAGHKRECSKLRKQQQQQARLDAAAAEEAADDSMVLPADPGADGDGLKPVESNSTPPVPLKVTSGLVSARSLPAVPAALAACMQPVILLARLPGPHAGAPRIHALLSRRSCTQQIAMLS